VFATLEAAALSQEAARLHRMSWDELAVARAAADAEGWSQPLRLAVARALRATAQDAEPATATATATAPPAAAATAADDALPGLEDVLDAFDRGLLWMAVADRMPKPPQAARLTGRSARNFIRPRVFDGLAGLVHLRLIAYGHATADIAWSSGQPGIALPDAWERGMDDALDAATADTPDTRPLRALLADRHPAAVGAPPASPPGASASGALQDRPGRHTGTGGLPHPQGQPV
jgi:hypothetical protein